MPTAEMQRFPRSALHYRSLSERDTVPIPPWVPSRSSRTAAPIQPHGSAGTVSLSSQALPMRSSMHFAFVVLVAMLGLMALTLGLQAAWSWGTEVIDQIHYGYPRAYQVDAVVGHHDSAKSPSHFLAINVNGNIEIMEFPGGDASHARDYLASKMPGAGADRLPVTLSFTDRAHNNFPEMEVHVGDSMTFRFKNEQGAFILEEH